MAKIIVTFNDEEDVYQIANALKKSISIDTFCPHNLTIRAEETKETKSIVLDFDSDEYMHRVVEKVKNVLTRFDIENPKVVSEDFLEERIC